MESILSALQSGGYQLDTETNVFSRSDFKDISYSDGNEIESRILNAIKDTHIIDSLSDELEVHCIDWPSTYHLSKRRGNLMRPFLEKFSGKTRFSMI